MGRLYISEIQFEKFCLGETLLKGGTIPVQYFEMNNPPGDMFRQLWSKGIAYFKTGFKIYMYGPEGQTLTEGDHTLYMYIS